MTKRKRARRKGKRKAAGRRKGAEARGKIEQPYPPEPGQTAQPGVAARTISALRNPVLWVVLLLVIVGACLRLCRYGVVRMWIDEISVLWSGPLDKTPWEIQVHTIRNIFSTNEHMPFQWAWINFFLHCYHKLGLIKGMNDVSPWLARFPFVLLGILTLPLLYAAVRRVYGVVTGLWALLLCAVSFVHIWYSRDMTSYSPLLFFQAVNVCGLAGLLCAVPGQRAWKRIGYGALFVIGGAGMLDSHLTGWFFLAIEGMVLGISYIRSLILRKRQPGREGIRAGMLFLIMALLVLSCLPFMNVPYHILTDFRPPGTAKTSLTSGVIWLQLAFWGWGQGNGRLTTFCLVLLVGIAGLIIPKQNRLRGLAHLAFCLGPIILFFMSRHVGFSRRYVSVSFLPALVLAAVGLTVMTRGAGRFGGKTGRWVVAATACFIIIFWSIGPLRELYRMKSKSTPVGELVEWIDENIDEGGLYIWQSGYDLRDVPSFHQTPGRQAGWATYQSGEIPPEDNAYLGPRARDTFRRLPKAVFLITEGAYPKFATIEPWAWLETDFAKKETIRNEPCGRLWEWGLSATGIAQDDKGRTVLRHPDLWAVICCYNTEEDLIERARTMGVRTVGWPSGTSWRFVQSHQFAAGTIFMHPEGDATYRVLNLGTDDVTVEVKVLGAAISAGSVSAQMVRGGVPISNTLTQFFGHSNEGMHVTLGPFPLPPGESEIKFNLANPSRMSLLFHTIDIVPVESEPGP